MARVTLVVNDAREGSETFLHQLAGQLVVDGHRVTVHEQSPGRALMPAVDVGYASELQRSRSLPSVRHPALVAHLARLLRRDRSTVGALVRRSVRRWGITARAARAVLLAAPLATTHPDVVHLAFSGIGVALDDALQLLDPEVKLIVSCRGSGELVNPVIDPGLEPALARLFLRADVVHVVCGAIADVVRRLAPGASIAVIRPAVDLDRFSRDGGPDAGVVGSPARLVTVSRLHWVKAIGDQLSALALLVAAGVDAELTVVGDGPEAGSLRVRARSLGVEDRVHLTGARPPDEVRSLVRGADVFVLSSLSEGTSNAVLEAMALGLPVVATAVGGMPEVLTHGQDALLVPAGDPAAIAEAVQRLVREPGLAEQISAGATRTVATHGLDRLRAQWSELYTGVVGASTPGG